MPSKLCRLLQIVKLYVTVTSFVKSVYVPAVLRYVPKLAKVTLQVLAAPKPDDVAHDKRTLRLCRRHAYVVRVRHATVQALHGLLMKQVRQSEVLE